MSDQAALLAKLHQDTRTPPPELVKRLDKGKFAADYVGHADITDILLAHDPLWSWEPLTRDESGLPKITVDKSGRLTMWATLTIHGHSRIEVGTALATSPDPFKELVGDFLRRGAMRFGVSLQLWSKSDWSEQGATPASSAGKPAAGPDAVSRFIARGSGDLEDRLYNLDADQTAEMKTWRRGQGLAKPLKTLTAEQRAAIGAELDRRGWARPAEAAPEGDCAVEADLFGDDEPF